ncbi:MAG TPA: adenosine deaminase, partial [Terriglobus sp.]
MTILSRMAALVVVAGVCSNVSPAQATPGAEARVSARLESIRNSPPQLRAFLTRMPKGGDLHMHLSGAVYAETFIANAAEDNLCVDPVKLVLLPNIGTTRSLPPKPVCAEGTEPAATAFSNQALYDKLVDSFSMRAFVPYAGWNGHDQFFVTFGKFSGIQKQHLGEWVDEVATRAAAQNEQYLEIMNTPDFGVALKLAAQQHWDGDAAKMREAMLAGGLRDNIAVDRADMDEMDRVRKEREHCDTPQATAACTVQV